jgi:hypothetical protein
VKVCFLISNDFGELNLAVSMASGATFDPVFLLPPRLHTVNPAISGLRLYGYRSGLEVAAILQRETPDALVLCSGYLLLFGQNVDVAGFDLIRRTAEGLGCLLLTTDPFLGYWYHALCGRNNAFQDPRGLGAFEFPARALARVPHLFTIDPGPNVMPNGWMVRLATFPEMMANLAEQNTNEVPVWLFLLAQEDYKLQVLRTGKERFYNWLGARLGQVEELGRRPVLIAPDACISSVAQRVPGMDRNNLLSFCGYDTFRRLCYGVEYCFYWNPVSNTIVDRFRREQPFFCFDNGHLAHALPDVWTAGLEVYYSGRPPELLRMQDPFDPEALKAQAERERAIWAPIRARLRGCRPLQVILEEILPAQPV